jgi:hypothetical protein
VAAESPPDDSLRGAQVNRRSYQQSHVKRGWGSPLKQASFLSLPVPGPQVQVIVYGQQSLAVCVTRTNNGTELVIGRMKMLARTVRGYKTWPGIQTGLMLAGTNSN